MNIFDYEGKDFDKKLNEIFNNINKEQLKQELIECGLVIKEREEKNMKIIKEGHPYRYTCQKCECVFEIEENDIKKREEIESNDAYNFFVREIHFVNCPSCESEIRVGEASHYEPIDPSNFKLRCIK